MWGNFRSLLIIIFVLSLNFVYGQSDQKEVLVAGKVINSKSGESIPLAHLILNSKRKIAFCDEWGVYRIVLSPGDSLKVTALGYKPTTFILPDTINRDMYNDIKLQPISYKLQEVTIYNLGTWEQFRYDFIHLKIEPTKKEKIISDIKKNLAYCIKNKIKEYNAPNDALSGLLAPKGVISSFGLSTGVPLGNKYERPSDIKIKALSKEYKYAKILAAKYNREIVSEITGEKSKERLDKLMAYINKNGHFTYKTTEIKILSSIKSLYARFIIDYPLKGSKFEQDSV